MDDKKSIIKSFSGGRTESSKELTFNEAGAVIAHFQSMDQEDRRSNKMRNYVLSMAHEMGWEKEGIKIEVAGTTYSKKKVDVERVNNWCVKFGYLHKKLDEYTYEELPKLVSQFEEVYKGHLKGV
jgi:hypothetical protein